MIQRNPVPATLASLAGLLSRFEVSNLEFGASIAGLAAQRSEERK